jgi:hypothetical protein
MNKLLDDANGTEFFHRSVTASYNIIHVSFLFCFFLITYLIKLINFGKNDLSFGIQI